MAGVGLEREAIAELKGVERPEERISVRLEVEADAYFPQDYIDDPDAIVIGSGIGGLPAITATHEVLLERPLHEHALREEPGLPEEHHVVQVPLLDGDEGTKLTFDEVLMLGGGEQAKIGSPVIDKAKVEAEIKAGASTITGRPPLLPHCRNCMSRPV